MTEFISCIFSATNFIKIVFKYMIILNSLLNIKILEILWKNYHISHFEANGAIGKSHSLTGPLKETVKVRSVIKLLETNPRNGNCYKEENFNSNKCKHVSNLKILGGGVYQTMM